MKKEENKEKKKVETAVLSTTAKVKARTDRKKKDGADAEMSASDVSLAKQDSEAKKPDDQKMDVDEAKKEGEEEKKEGEEEKKEEEPTEATLKNPCRVVKQQEESMQYLKDSSRYYPILDSRFSGFVVL